MKKQSDWKRIKQAMIFTLLLIAVPALSRSAAISGMVRDSTGIPVTGTGNEIGISVWTGDPCRSYNYVTGTSTNSVDGTFSVDGLPAGTYHLMTHYNNMNYVNEWRNGDSPDPSDHGCSVAQSITVAAGDSVTATDFRLEVGATITGTLYQSDGTTPITGVNFGVSFFTGDSSNGYHFEGTPVDQNTGEYSMSDLPAGTYYFRT